MQCHGFSKYYEIKLKIKYLKKTTDYVCACECVPTCVFLSFLWSAHKQQALRAWHEDTANTLIISSIIKPSSKWLLGNPMCILNCLSKWQVYFYPYLPLLKSKGSHHVNLLPHGRSEEHTRANTHSKHANHPPASQLCLFPGQLVICWKLYQCAEGRTGWISGWLLAALFEDIWTFFNPPAHSSMESGA